MKHLILVINPGSTSTKISIFENEKELHSRKISHSLDIILSFPNICSQLDFRYESIITAIKEFNITCEDLTCVCGRGGMLKPLESGTYKICEAMVGELKENKYGQHASNLGTLIAYEIGKKFNIPAYITNPVSVDEMNDIARISGIPGIVRQSFFHALNHKAIGKQVAYDNNNKYENMNLIIAHLGGGISVGAHYKGRVIDVNESLEGDGPMTPERSGSVPLGQLYRMCFSGKYTLEEISRMNHGRGGLAGYLENNNAVEIVKKIKEGDSYSKLIYDAMIYQIAKEIGAYATVMNGEVNYIILTGGLAYEEYLVSHLIKKVGFIAEVLIYPGENEMLSLAKGALQVLNGQEIGKNY